MHRAKIGTSELKTEFQILIILNPVVIRFTVNMD